MSSIRLADLAQQLNATLHGDGDLVITGIAPMHSANSGQITFLSDARYRKNWPVVRRVLWYCVKTIYRFVRSLPLW